MDDSRRVQLSKFLSYVLRHHPEAIGISLDDGGWARVDELLAGAKRIGKHISKKELVQVVERGPKRRFSLGDDHRRVRANYGHSIPIDLDLEPREPPETLFHGTAERNVESIFQLGLKPKGRRFVHLSTDAHAAREVGSRHGEPAVLRIEARRMHETGHDFYQTEAGVWLTEHVPGEYLRRPAAHPN